MKPIFVSIVLAVGILAAGGLLLLVNSTPRPPGPLDDGATQRLADEVATLEKVVVGLSDRCLSLEEEVRTLSQRTSGSERVARVFLNDSGGDSDAAAGTSSRAADLQAGVSSVVAGQTEGGEAAVLRAFVAQVIEDDRVERQSRQKADAQRRREEWQALNQGPYGKFNHKVNSLAAKLGLTDQQAQQYYNLLVDYESRSGELRKGVRWGDAEARKDYEEKRSILQVDFENAVSWNLDREQKDAFAQLPQWERSVDGSSFISGGGGPFNIVTTVVGDGIGGEGGATAQIIVGGVGGDDVPPVEPVVVPLESPSPGE